MILEKKVYDIPVVTNDKGHSLIDMSLIKLMLYVDSFGFNANKRQEKVSPVDTKAFKSKLNYIFMNSLITGPYPWRNPNTVIGEAPGLDICFDINKIEEFKNEIDELLSQVGDIAYFSDLRILRDGQIWTKLKQDIQKLLALGSASGLIDYSITNINMYDNNPKLTKTK